MKSKTITVGAVAEKIHALIKPGADILLLVPPFTANSPTIAPHLLADIAKGAGFRTDILYLNLLLGSFIGFDLVEKLGPAQQLQYWGMLNERLFARSAHGLPKLGLEAQTLADEALSISGNVVSHRWMDYDARIPLDYRDFLPLEETCFQWVDATAEVLGALPYKIIGFTCRMGQINCSIGLINRIKAQRPEVITIMGGAACAGDMAEGVVSLSE